MDYDYKKIRGLIIEECTPTMHVAIVAKALGVPVISGIYGFFKEVKDGAIVGINGKDGADGDSFTGSVREGGIGSTDKR